MVRAVYTNRKGIYKDLYRTLDYEKKQDPKPAEREHRGIYINLYRQFEDDKSNVFFKCNKRKEKKLKFLIIIKKIIDSSLSRVTYFFSSTASEIKLLIIACIVAKKPINNYIENNLPIYQNQNLGLYND